MNFICEYPNVMRSVFKVQQKIRGDRPEFLVDNLIPNLFGEKLKRLHNF